MEATSSALVQRVAVRELIACYDQAVRDVIEADRLLRSAQRSLDDRFRLGGYAHTVYITLNGSRSNDHDMPKVLARMERDAWRCVVERLDILRFMSTKSAKELENQIETNALPPLTLDNAMQLAKKYIGDIASLFDELIVEVFDMLRPKEHTKASNYARNDKEVIGKRVIMTYPSDQQLSCLENVFMALDGAGVVHRNYYPDVVVAIRESRDGTGQTKYFKFRKCQNGNLHLQFLREDLLAELNRRAGGLNLRKGAK